MKVFLKDWFEVGLGIQIEFDGYGVKFWSQEPTVANIEVFIAKYHQMAISWRFLRSLTL